VSLNSDYDTTFSYAPAGPKHSNRSEHSYGHKWNFLTDSDLWATDLNQTKLILPDPSESFSDATADLTSESTTSSTDVLFLQQPGDPQAIDIKDVNQGQIGDCSLLASIANLALYDPNVIMHMIHANADGTETVTLYTNSDGSLINISTYQAPSPTATFRAVSLTVNNTFPSNAVNNIQPAVNGQTEIWVQVLEEAVAKLYSAGGAESVGYALLNNGGFSLGAMEVLTGLPGSSIIKPTITAAQLSSDVAAGDLITVSTTGTPSTTLDLVDDHEYALEGITTVNGTPMVQLYNPWGDPAEIYNYWIPFLNEVVPASIPGALPVQPSLIPLSSLLAYLDTNSGGYYGAITISPPPPPPPPPRLQGDASQYIVADDNGAAYVQDTVAGRDGTQTLPDATAIQFADGVGVFDPTGTAEDVARLYGAAFHRPPDLAGLQAWTADIDESHVPLSVVAADFVASAEFTQDYGSLSNTAFVTQLYKNVLNRAPDAAGAQAWENDLAGGMSRGTVLLGFAESQEYDADTLSTAGDNDNGEVYRLYGAALGRTPDPAGQAVSSSALAAGETVTQVAQGFVDSAEFQQKYGNLSISDFVTALYKNVLNRAPDAAGLQAWTSALQGGESKASVVVGFSDSLEYRAATADATHANWVFIPSATA
jgi:hypothetical protein